MIAASGDLAQREVCIGNGTTMRHFILGLAAASLLAITAMTLGAAEAQKYTLRYKFHPGETLCWEVEHRSMLRASVARATQTTETLSTSEKAWRVIGVDPDGTATFEHRVNWLDMRQSLTGRAEVHYDSRTGGKPPVGYADVAKSVGVPLSVVKMDAHGKVLHRKDLRSKPASSQDNSTPQNEGWMTIPLPNEPVALGHSWSLPLNIDVPLPGGTVTKIKALQQFEFQRVDDGVAIIRVSTDILTPITDPAVESQLVQRESAGTVRFDIDEGRIIGQRMDTDKHVVGFRGGASSLHYVNRFSERLLPESGKTVRGGTP
jgi:hypothetical protein